MRPVNPYIVGNPIKDASVFFGRRDIFRDVLQVLRQPGSNAIVLYGQRRIGKTSVLLQLEKQLAQAGEFTPVYFDLQDKASKSLSEVLYELSQHIARVTGHTVAKSSDFDRSGDYFRSVFLPEIAQKVATGGLVLLFDEFDVLDSPMQTQASEAFFPYLRAWMTDVQKVKFVFVIGRRPEDLSVRTMSTFKGIQSTRVSFLSAKDARELVLQSERDKSLEWEESAVRRVIELTHGHPYFTQLLCSVIWENAYEAAPGGTPQISVREVDASVGPALKFGANAFNWLWDGLPPAERVVVAAMAEVPEAVITQDKLIETLNQSGVRLVARQLEVAPETLIDWEVLIESKGAYRFAVPLLRGWVLANRPLRRVKEELDRLDPLADTLFRGGQGFYSNNNLEAAEQQLRQALQINPNHLKARLLLGQVLLEKGNLAESVDMLEAAYQYDERAARAQLIRSLLALAEIQEENLQLSTYKRILNIQSDQPLANEKTRSIWVKRGEAFQAQENFEEALKAFEQIGDTERIEKVRQSLHERKLLLDMQNADAYEGAGQWKSALDALIQLKADYPENETIGARLENARMRWRAESLERLKAIEETENWDQVLELYEALQEDFPEDAEVQARAERAHRQLSLKKEYQEALEALRTGQNDKARQLLSHVLGENPSHFPAAQKLIEATYGEVKITRPVPWPLRAVTILGSVFWSLLTFAFLGGLLWPVTRFGILYLVEQRGRVYNVAAEGLLAGGLLLGGLISFAMHSYATGVTEKVLRVQRKENRSLGQALWTHILFGLGMFYVDPSARRKWLYAAFAIAIPLIVLLGPLVVGAAHTGISVQDDKLLGIYVGQEEKANIIWALAPYQSGFRVLLSVLLAGYLLSYADVIITYYRPRQPGQEAQPVWRSERTEGVRKFFKAIVVSFQRFWRWLRSRTWLQLLGVATIVVLGLFVPLGIAIPISADLSAMIVLLLMVAIFAWLVLAILVILQGAWKLITRLAVKAKKSGSVSRAEEPGMVSDTSVDPTLKP